jgi:hypothetical protein
VAALGFVLTVTFECKPISGAYLGWSAEVPTKCINTNTLVVVSKSNPSGNMPRLHMLTLVFAGGAINIALDLAVFALPIPKVMKLNASLHKRLGVCLTFLVGTNYTVSSDLIDADLS